MTNPTVMSYAELQGAYRKNAEQRKNAIDSLTEHLAGKAQAEADYRKAFAIAFARHRSEGKPVPQCEAEAKADTVHFSLLRDMEDAKAKGAAARLEQLKDDRATLRHLAEVGREDGG